MKVEAWFFGVCAGFFLVVTPGYWIATSYNLGGGDLTKGDWTGTTALFMTMLLAGMVAVYLGYHAKTMEETRPEDNREAEVADGAGELGFFPPYSWWPLWCAVTLAFMVYGIAIHAWWLFIMGLGVGFVTLSGWVFEYYRGEHAH